MTCDSLSEQETNKNRIEFIVDGDKGAVAGDRQDLQIDGNVQIQSGNGYILTCRSAKYFAKSRELIGEGPIKVFDGDKKAKEKFNLTGSRLKINVPDSKMYIFGPVLARRELNAEKFVTLKSQRAMLSSLSSEVIFSENLEIIYNNFIVHGQEAQLKFQDKDKVLQKIYIKGGVKLKDSIRRATADSVEIDFKTQNISLNGNPYVVSGEDEIRGDKIILVDGGKKVIVDKLKAKLEKIEK